jgi:hypothetical protein
MEGNSIVWTFTKDGSTAGYTGSLTNSGGSIIVGGTGTYILTATVTDSEGRVFTHSESITVANTAPNTPPPPPPPQGRSATENFL